MRVQPKKVACTNKEGIKMRSLVMFRHYDGEDPVIFFSHHDDVRTLST